MQDPAIGKEVDGYRILDVLGRGGMGVVYQAEDVALSRTVALKRIDPALASDETFLRRFRSEARALARIDSPHIVSVHALRKTDLGLLIVMEYVDGGTLKDRILGEGAMDLAEAIPLIDHMLAALEDAHGAGVVHRDIKPHNIMLTQGGHVKVTDFGLAKVHRPDDQKTVTQGVYGTLNYMSPEQVQGLGQVDPRSDIYSLGMTVYEMLTGRLPFDKNSGEFALMRTIVEEELPPPDRFRPDLPRPLVDWVAKTLGKEPDRRFQSAAAMRRALKRIETKLDRGEARDEMQNDGAGRASGATAAKKLQYAMVTVLVLVLGLGGYIAYHQLLGGGGVETESAPEPVSSMLTVSTDPPGANVALNGQALGSTPLSDVAVTGDSLDLRLQKDGYRTIDTTLYLADGRDPSLNVPLSPLASTPPADDPAVADAGDYTPAEPDDASYSGDSDPSTDASDDPPEPAPPARGTLRMAVVPQGTATAYIDGVPREVGAVELSAGSHTVRFRHPDYGEKDTTVAVAAGDTTAITCYFEQEIFVNLEGAWGRVWINDKDTDENTPFDSTGGPGTYRIELRRSGYTVPDGAYYKSVGDDRYKVPFEGNTKEITVKPICTSITHSLFFRTTQGSL